MKIAYVTDSGTGYSIEELARDGIISIPLQIFDGETTYQDMENLNRNQCIELLKQEKVLKTSQPSPGLVEEAFTSLKNQGTDLIIAVPICNGLSGSASILFVSPSSAISFNDLPNILDCHIRLTSPSKPWSRKLIISSDAVSPPIAGVTSVSMFVMSMCIAGAFALSFTLYFPP